MSNRLSLKIPHLVVLAVALFALPAPAFAGFQWVTPSDGGSNAAPSASLPSVVTTPLSRSPNSAAATESPEVLSPVVIDGNGASSVSPSMPSLGRLDAGSDVKTVSAASAAAPTDTYVVHGFAKMVPLAVALRQILPPGYAFSIDPNVDLGVLVSFQGGRAWRDTLRDALDPAGLVVHEQGQMVVIGYADAAPPAPNAGTTTATTTVSTTTTKTPSMHPETTLTPLPMPQTISGAPGLGSPMPMGDRSQWRAERGDSLRKIMENWCHRANVELNWMAEYDYPLEASVVFSGTFEEAVRNLLTGFEDAHPQPVAELHANANLGQRVLVIETRGNNYSN